MENKNNYLNILLKNPRTSKILLEGWGAPLGSTKRSKAKTIIKTIRKRSGDGQGGSFNLSAIPQGYSNEQFNPLPSTPPVMNSYSTLNSQSLMTPASLPLVLKPAPAEAPPSLSPKTSKTSENISPAITNASSQMSGFLGSGGTRSTDGKGGPYDFSGYNPFQIPTLSDPLRAPVPLNTGARIANPFARLWPALTSSWNRAKERQTGAQTEQPQTMVGKAFGDFKTAQFGGYTVPWGGLPTPQNPLGQPGQPAQPVQAFGMTPAPASMLPAGTTPITPNADQYGSPIGPQQASPYTAPGAPATPAGTVTPEPATPGSQWANLLTQGDPNQPIAAQVRSIMGNKAQMSALYPDVPEEYLPGATLSGTVDQFATKLKETTGLNDLLRQKTNLVNAGHYLMSDLDDYIRGKDTYVKEVDTMIKGVKDKLLSGGTSTDPTTMKSTNDYLNMLYTLKGQQSKRYMDLVNSASEKYTADMASLDNTVTMAAAEYEDRLASGTAILQEEYNMMFSTISSYLSSYQTGIDANGWSTAGMYAAGSAASNAVEGAKQTDVSGLFADLDPIFTRPGESASEKIFDSTGLAAKIHSAITFGNQTPEAVHTYLLTKIRDMKYSGDLGTIEQLKNSLLDLQGAKEQTEIDANGNIWTYGDKIFGAPGKVQILLDSFGTIIREPLGSNIQSSIDEVRTATKELMKIDDINDQREVDQWREDNSLVDSTILTAILNVYKLSLNRDQASVNPFLGGTKLSDLSDTELKDIITGAISESWIAESLNN